MWPSDYFPCHLLPTLNTSTTLASTHIRPFVIKVAQLQTPFWHCSSPSLFTFPEYTELFLPQALCTSQSFWLGKSCSGPYKASSFSSNVTYLPNSLPWLPAPSASGAGWPSGGPCSGPETAHSDQEEFCLPWLLGFGPEIPGGRSPPRGPALCASPLVVT